MIALLQRVQEARVDHAGTPRASIGPGLLVFVGIHKEDTQEKAERLAERILSYRVFADAENRMNQSLQETGGGLLLVPQFTLAARTDRGRRASFSSAAVPEVGRQRFESLLAACQARHSPVHAGIFQTDQQVALVNDGPVTFILTV